MALQALEKEEMFKAAPHQIQADYHTVVELVDNLTKKITPASSSTSTWWQAVLKAAVNFFLYAPPKKGGAGSLGTLLRGAEGVKQAYTDVSKRFASAEGKKSLGLADIDELQAYKWVLSKDEQTKLVEIVAHVYRTTMSGAKASATKRAKKDEKSGAASSSSSKNDKSDIMGLFTGA